MSEYNYNYHDDNFSLDAAERYNLLIQIEQNSFAYAITDQDKLVACADMHPLDELSNPDELLDLLSARYKQVVIGLPSSGFTLVPTALFSENKTAAFARLLNVDTKDKVLAQSLNADNVIIYKTPANVIKAADDFGLRNTVFTSKGWLKAIAQNNPANNNLYLHITYGIVEITAFADGKLRIYNRFAFQNTDELAYFTVLVAQELELQPASVNIYINGNVEADDQQVKRLADFFAEVQLHELQVVQLPREIPAHQILPLAALSLCVS